MGSQRLARSVALLTPLIAARPAAAAGGEGDASVRVAKQFFDKALQRMDEGKCETSPVRNADACEEARELLQRAYAIYPDGLGALRNLARVERALGLYASAARHLRELARKAPLDPKPSRQLWATFAKRELLEVEPLVSYVVLRLDGPAPPDLAVSLEGAPMPIHALDVRLDVDPGEHVVVATAPGRAPFRATVRTREGETQTVVLRLDPQPSASAPGAGASGPTTRAGAGAVATPERASAAVPSRAPAASAGPSRLAPILTIAGGAVAVAAGLGLGWVALQKRIDACGSSVYCDPAGLASGKSFATASTVVTSVGAAALVGGAVWYFLAAPSRTASPTVAVTPWVAPTFAGLSLRGAL